MNSSLLLLGLGTAGCTIARGVQRAYGSNLRLLLADTDAKSAVDDAPFVLLGGDRLSGRGAGGDVTSGRLAAMDSLHSLDEHLASVRLVVLVTSLGGGTGSGATYEISKYLTDRGVPVIVFATQPFTFEGEDRQRNTRGVTAMISDAASAAFFPGLDQLVEGSDNMEEALRRALDTMSGAISLFWRLVEKPGYIRLDVERLRHLMSGAGRGRFATVTVQGPNRVEEALDRLMRSPLLANPGGPVSAALCGVLAGEDLRLSEVGKIAEGVRNSFPGLAFELATVNDENAFSGRLSVVVLLFESATVNQEGAAPSPKGSHKRPRYRPATHVKAGRFKDAEPTIVNGENLDSPTYLRKGLSLDI